MVYYDCNALFSQKGDNIMVRRKDKKGRVLNTGESQREDGKYVFQYMDSKGKRKSVYSWKLIPSDVTPAGKRKDISLREKEKVIQSNLSDGIVADGGNLTVIDLVNRYVSQKKGARYNTRKTYGYVERVLKKEKFGNVRIDKIKPSDAKLWAIKLQSDGKKYKTIQLIFGVIKPAFETAIEDDLIRKNPFSFSLKTVIMNDAVKRTGIGKEQELSLLNFIKKDKHYSRYYEAIYILLHTGIRISELCGITISDIDFENKILKIDHQLQKNDNEYRITSTKSLGGIRQIPLTDDLCECFKKVIHSRKPKVEPIIEGKTGFLFLKRDGMPTVYSNWDDRFRNILKSYNAVHENKISMTPHICRHTFCSNMAEAKINIKSLQYLMGHSNVSITLDTYTHLKFDDMKKDILDAQSILAKKENKISI